MGHPVRNKKQRSLKKVRLGFWIQYDNYNTKAECDSILAFAREYHITDICPMVIDYDTNPSIAYGNTGSLMRKTSIVIDGVTPMEYLAREAKALDISVSVWWCIHFFYSWWGGTNAVLLSPLSETYHDTSGGADILMFNSSYARTQVINAMKEFSVANPSVGSVTLDYIRSDGYSTTVTAADITAFVSEVRTAIPDREIIVNAITVYDYGNMKQDIATWTANNYINAVMGMAAYDPYCKKKYGWDRWSMTNKSLMVANYSESGDGEFAMAVASDSRATFRQHLDLGYIHFGLFDSRSTSWMSTTQKAVILEYLKGQVQATAPYPQVSSITVTPDSSISLVIGGSTYTTYNADVTDHVSTYTLKTHIEGVEGQRPWIHYIRPTSTTIEVCVGDWIP